MLLSKVAELIGAVGLAGPVAIVCVVDGGVVGYGCVGEIVGRSATRPRGVCEATRYKPGIVLDSSQVIRCRCIYLVETDHPDQMDLRIRVIGCVETGGAFQTESTLSRDAAERIHTIARIGVAFIWIWHGLVPKILVQDSVEIVPLLQLDIAPDVAWKIVTVAGMVEMVFGLLVLLFRRARWPFVVTMVGMLGLLIGVFVTAPELTGGAFNPVTLNITVIFLALVGIVAMGGEKASSERAKQTGRR